LGVGLTIPLRKNLLRNPGRRTRPTQGCSASKEEEEEEEEEEIV
jgi:hypothetical protein